jgi:hypothetical protein
VVTARGALGRLAALLGVAALATTVGACEQILGAISGDRHVDPHVDCSGPTCVCTGGFGDCNGNVNDGCETELSASPNCGACGVTCANGACIASACVCAAGFADCDDMTSNGCETNVADDPHNCGACSHDCGAGSCVGGVCAAATVAAVPSATTLAADGSNVYVGACGGTPTLTEFTPPSASPTALAPSGCPLAIASASGYVVWATSTAILSNGPTATLVSGVQPSAWLASGGDAVYWWDAGAKALLRVPLTGGATATIGLGAITALTADFENAYWSDAAGIHVVAHTSVTPSLLTNAVQARALASSGFGLYALDASGVEVVQAAGAVQTLPEAALAESIAADSGGVYWSQQDGTLHNVPLSRTSSTVLASGESFAAGLPIAVGASGVFWIAGGDLRTVGK